MAVLPDDVFSGTESKPSGVLCGEPRRQRAEPPRCPQVSPTTHRPTGVGKLCPPPPQLLTLDVSDLILPKMEFLLVKTRSSSASSPSMMAQLSGAGSSLSRAAAFSTSLEYLYSSLGTHNHGITSRPHGDDHLPPRR